MSEEAKPVCAMATAHRCIFAYVAPGQHVCIAETIARNTQALMQSSAIEITALRAALDNITAERDLFRRETVALAKDALAMKDALDQEREKVTALREYVEHWESCENAKDWAMDCTCGLKALLSGRDETAT